MAGFQSLVNIVRIGIKASCPAQRRPSPMCVATRVPSAGLPILTPLLRGHDANSGAPMQVFCIGPREEALALRARSIVAGLSAQVAR